VGRDVQRLSVVAPEQVPMAHVHLLSFHWSPIEKHGHLVQRRIHHIALVHLLSSLGMLVLLFAVNGAVVEHGGLDAWPS